MLSDIVSLSYDNAHLHVAESVGSEMTVSSVTSILQPCSVTMWFSFVWTFKVNFKGTKLPPCGGTKHLNVQLKSFFHDSGMDVWMTIMKFFLWLQVCACFLTIALLNSATPAMYFSYIYRQISLNWTDCVHDLFTGQADSLSDLWTCWWMTLLFSSMKVWTV